MHFNYEARLTGIAVDDLLQSTTGVFNNLQQSDIIEIGHSIENLVLDCTYAGLKCNLSTDFQRFQDSSFYNCYTFTGSDVTTERDIGSGPSNGLSLILYLESSVDGNPYNFSTAFKYSRYAQVENGMGVRLEIHDKNALPNPKAAGYDVMPGHTTSLQLASTRVVKQSEPYGNCTYRKRLKGLSAYDYSSARCIDVCLAEYVFAKCGCASGELPITESIQAGDWKYCRKFNNATGMTTSELFENIDCELTSLSRFGGDQKYRHECGCYGKCEYWIFTETISEAQWPAPLYVPDMYNEFVLEHDNYTGLKAYQQLNDIANNPNRTADFQALIWSNFTRINIFFKDVLVVNIDEYPTYDTFTLLANIGGTVGLWAGLSMITVVEVIFLIGNLLSIAIRRCVPAKVHNNDD